MTKPDQEKPEDTLELYNEHQLWWAMIKDNCNNQIKQFEDAVKLQKEIKILAKSKIEELSTK